MKKIFKTINKFLEKKLYDYYKIKLIILTLSLLSFLFAAAGGTLYYFKVKHSLLKEARQRCAAVLNTVNKNFSLFMVQYELAIKALSRLPEIKKVMKHPLSSTLTEANYVLDVFCKSFKGEACYLMNLRGITIASSNRNSPDSFVGKNFSFRPYFKGAIRGFPTIYPALGTTSGKRGVYFSSPIYVKGKSSPIGVAVIKASIEYLESRFLSRFPGIFFFIDPHGIIFISNKKKWLFYTIKILDSSTIKQIKESKQMGKGPWLYSGFKIQGDRALDARGRRYLVFETKVDLFPQWKLLYLLEEREIFKNLHRPILEIGGPVIFISMFLVGILVYFLSRIAQRELKNREKIEQELRKSEEKYRSIYHNTPAMLHSIDREYRLLRVSDYWLEATGYTRKEVIGRRLTEFFTDESRKKAEELVLPHFFKKGHTKNIHYQFIKKNGDVMDILLSCYGIRNSQGEVVETLAISVDMTERLKEQRELKRAKKKLSNYSRELEKLVKQRSREIDAILRYTPSIIYLKNKKLCYRLINPGFEKFFHVSSEEVQGKGDEEILPQDIARQFHKTDQEVLENRSPSQIKEVIKINGHTYTFLSIRFPIYNEEGEIEGVGGISTDITELEKAQKKLKELSKNIIKNQEIERARISKELHDELGQILTVLNMDASWLEKRLKKIDPVACSRIQGMKKLIDRTIDEVRNLAFQLRPATLDHLGFIEALESLISDFEKRTPILYNLRKSSIPPIDNTTSTALYRIVQEAITNSIRHASPQRIDIEVVSRDGYIEVKVKDDGKGFLLKDKLLASAGFGIAGMQERAELVRGEVKIKSSPLQGTEVICRVPV